MKGTLIFVRTQGESPLIFQVAEELAVVVSRIQAAAQANRGVVMAFAKFTCICGLVPTELLVRVDEILAIEDLHTEPVRIETMRPVPR